MVVFVGTAGLMIRATFSSSYGEIRNEPYSRPNRKILSDAFETSVFASFTAHIIIALHLKALTLKI